VSTIWGIKMKIEKNDMILILIGCVLGCMLIVAGCGKSVFKKEPKEPTTVTIILIRQRTKLKFCIQSHRIISALTADEY